MVLDNLPRRGIGFAESCVLSVMIRLGKSGSRAMPALVLDRGNQIWRR